MKSLLKGNIFRNGIATVFQKLSKVLEQLLLVPFFISAWGVAYYGEWLTLTIIPTVLAFSDLGFSTAAANSFVLKFTSGAKKDASDVFKTGVFLTTLTIFCGILLSIFTLFILNEFNIFDKSLINKHDAIWSISILILARLINFYSQLFTSRFIAIRKASVSINLITISSFMKLILGFLVLILGYGVIEFAMSQLIASFLFNIFYVYKSFNILPVEKEYRGIVKKEYINDLTKKGISFLMLPVWQSIYFQGTTFVVRIVLGSEAVVVFNTVRKLSRTVNQLFIIVNGTVFPELQYEIGKKNFHKAQRLFRRSILIIFVVAVFGTIFLLLFGLKFYNIWTNNELIVPTVMWYVFIVGILFYALWWTASMIFRAINKPLFFAKMGVLAAIISVIVSYFLGQSYGLNGVAIGSLVLDVILASLLLPKACSLLGYNVKELLLEGSEEIKSVFHKVLHSQKKGNT